MRPLWTIGLLGFAACSAPNPYLDESESSRSTSTSNFLVTTMSMTSAGSNGTEGAEASTTESLVTTSVADETSEESEDSIEGHDTSDPTRDATDTGELPGETTGGTTDGDASSDSGNIMMCPTETHRCLPPPPEGWRGPVAGWQGDPSNQPGCPSSLPDAGIDGGMNLQGTGTTCVCECTPSNAGCTGCESSPGCDFILISTRAGLDCAEQEPGVGEFWGHLVFDDRCSAVNTLAPTDSLAQWMALGLPRVDRGRCNVTSSSSYEEPYYAERFASCRPQDGFPLCEDGSGLCAPRSVRRFDEGMCIYRSATGTPEEDGPSACPAEYPNHRLIYGSGFNDTRSCTACSCGDRPTGQCQGWVSLYGQSSDGSTCSGLLRTITPNPDWDDTEAYRCEPVNGRVRSVQWHTSSVDARCSRSGGRAQGTVEPLSATVVCCTGPDVESDEATSTG